MTTISVRELKAKASEILRNLEATGEEIIITRHGKPCGKLVPVEDGQQKKVPLSTFRGKLDFLPELEYKDFQEIKKIWQPRPFPEDE